jgi:hypothetical protein
MPNAPMNTKIHNAISSLVFTGHMVDLPGRKEPRFPQASVPAARAAIRKKIEDAITQGNTPPVGIASGARGGDILFHEECRARGLKTIIVLPFPPEEFERASVEGVPESDWVERFRRLWLNTPEADREAMGLPQNDEAYALCNTRILDRARALGRFHLIALWDGKGGDGPGGTADLVKQAKAQSDKADIVAPGEL